MCILSSVEYSTEWIYGGWHHVAIDPIGCFQIGFEFIVNYLL